jgi:Domain of unknown function (DUF4365)
MPTFPRRAQTHVLEDRSKRFFLDRVPSSWVIHEPKQGGDYGTDFIVDVPSADGLCRGTSFRVQIKATSHVALRDNLVRIRIKIRHLRYLLVRLEPTMLLLYVDDGRMLFYAWLDEYGPHDGCFGTVQPWWQRTRPLAPDSSIDFGFDANDRVDSPGYEQKVEQKIYEYQELLFHHGIFWSTVDSLVDDVNARRFRNFSYRADDVQYLEVSIIPRELKERRTAVMHASQALSYASDWQDGVGLQWHPEIRDALETRAQFRLDGSYCVAWARKRENRWHIEITELVDILRESYGHWRGSIGSDTIAHLEIAGLRMKDVLLHWKGNDYPLKRYYFFASVTVSSNKPPSQLKRVLAQALMKQLKNFIGAPCSCQQFLRDASQA